MMSYRKTIPLTILGIITFLFLSYGFIYIKDYLELKNLHKYPISYFLSDELYGGEILVTYDDGKHVVTENLINDGKRKTHLQLSPNGQKLGYFLDLNYFVDKEKNKEINFIDYNNYTALIIMNIDGRYKKEIYKGDYHTSNWEWLNDDEVIVYYNCGSGCSMGFIIDVHTGIKKSKFLYGLGYKWSPNKELVVAHHYNTGAYGITVGDKYGNTLFEFIRSGPLVYSKLVDKTEASWSEDGKILTLTIKKEGKEELEIIKFDVDNNFQIIS